VLDEGLDGSDTASFPEENAGMTVCEGHPPPPLIREALHVQPRPQDPNSLRLRPRWLKSITTQVSHHLNKNINIYIAICYISSKLIDLI
jgi:hypothetical protein